MAAESGRKVLIATDGSESAEHAFDTYMKVLKKPDDHVLLLTCKEIKKVLSNAWNEAVYNYDPTALQEQLSKEEDEKKVMMKPYGDKLHAEGIKFKPLIMVSPEPGHSILHAAQSEKVDLIVLGSRGHGKIRRTLIGSVSDYVINHSEVPVVICRHPHDHHHHGHRHRQAQHDKQQH